MNQNINKNIIKAERTFSNKSILVKFITIKNLHKKNKFQNKFLKKYKEK